MYAGHDVVDADNVVGVVLVKGVVAVGAGQRRTSAVADDEDGVPRAAQSNPPTRIVMLVQLAVFVMSLENILYVTLLPEPLLGHA